MGKWRAGIVGLHRGGGLVSTLAAHPRVDIAALCDVDPALVEEMGAGFRVPEGRLYTRFEEFVNAPLDFVVIATPSSTTRTSPSLLLMQACTCSVSRPPPTRLMTASAW